MASENPNVTDWVWSEEHRNYYRNELRNGSWTAIWAPTTAADQTGAPQFYAIYGSTTAGHGLPPAAGGTADALDATYQIRTDARTFYVRGRMFATLHIEAYGGTATGAEDENVFIVKHGEKAYCQIRRFVVVKDDRGYCLACPIMTYRGRGTNKPGVNAEQHAIIFTTNSGPDWLPGETGMTKNPIGVDPADASVRLGRASRINFGQVHCIQHNVKVKDLGVVRLEDLPALVSYWRSEMQ